MRRKGLPDSLISVVKSAYTESSSRFVLNGCLSQPVFTDRGVKQGCPLSPTLFNLCLEPLLSAVRHKHSKDGIVIENTELGNGLFFNIQAYADDVVLVSNNEEGMQRMLDTVVDFCNFAGMKLAPNKCRCLTYALSGR